MDWGEHEACTIVATSKLFLLFSRIAYDVDDIVSWMGARL